MVKINAALCNVEFVAFFFLQGFKMYLFKSFYRGAAGWACLTLITLQLNGTHMLISSTIILQFKFIHSFIYF